MDSENQTPVGDNTDAILMELLEGDSTPEVSSLTGQEENEKTR